MFQSIKPQAVFAGAVTLAGLAFMGVPLQRMLTSPDATTTYSTVVIAVTFAVLAHIASGYAAASLAPGYERLNALLAGIAIVIGCLSYDYIVNNGNPPYIQSMKLGALYLVLAALICGLFWFGGLVRQRQAKTRIFRK